MRALNPLRFAPAVLFVALLTEACNPDDTMPAGPTRGGEAAAEAGGEVAAQLAPRRRGIETRFLAIETEVPGFGGFSIAPDGSVQAYVKDTGRGAAVIAAIHRHFPGPLYQTDEKGRPREILVAKGDYSISQLIAWKESLRDRLAGDPAAVLFDADEGHNRVRIGLTDLSARSRILDVASAVGIPESAMFFVEAGVMTPMVGVQDYHRPSTGGFKITFPGLSGYCTRGFNVYDDNGDRYHLTAAHCTANFSGPTGIFSYQAVAPDTIAQEDWNPAWPTTGCPQGYSRCPEADAALFEYTINPTWPGTYVAITTTIGQSSPGSLTVGDYAPITGFYDPPQYGTIYKTGARTGTTQGTVLGTCVDRAIGNDFHSCVQEDTLLTWPGDSGAPVFVHYSLWYDSYLAVGSFFAGDSAHNKSLVNTWENLTDHFGFDIYPDAPGQPMTVQVSGPPGVQEDMNCSWTAAISGDGTAPYEYTWLLDFEETTETSNTFDMYVEQGAQDFALSVIVQDSIGQIAGDTLQVTVGGSPPPPPC